MSASPPSREPAERTLAALGLAHRTEGARVDAGDAPTEDTRGRVRAVVARPPPRFSVPTALREARWVPSRPAVVGVVLVALAAVLGVGAQVSWTAWQARASAAADAGSLTRSETGDVGPPEPARVLGAPTGSPAPEAAASSDPGGGSVWVHVVGQVQRPGLVQLRPGARVADAVAAAGGASEEADLSAINLAAVVSDGQQVVVPSPGEQLSAGGGSGQGTGAGGSGAGGAGHGSLLDLNSADAAALVTLPGVGPVLAERIIAWRTTHGRFTNVDELQEVSGIGPAVLASVRDLVRV